MGVFLEYFKFFEVSFLFLKRKNTLASDYLKITFKCFLRFSRCFSKFAKHLIFIPKTIKSVFKGVATWSTEDEFFP